jgi:hypothetical protein
MKREREGDDAMMTETMKANFSKTGATLVYNSEAGYSMHRDLFSVTDEAKNQDGAPMANAALWSNAGECFSYISVKTTGHKETPVLGNWRNGYGVRCKVTFYGFDWESGRYVEESTAFGWVKN